MPERWNPDADSKFCLAGLQGYEASNPDHADKIGDFMSGRIEDDPVDKTVAYSCNIGQCTMQLAIGPEVGRKFTGSCRAASYCLKQTFEAVGQAPTVEEGQARYRDIYESLDGFVGGGNAGNFCPRISCGLSAGLSEDMVPGTAGPCELGDAINQEPLPFQT